MTQTAVAESTKYQPIDPKDAYVLVVEDNAVTRQALVDSLTFLNYQVLETAKKSVLMGFEFSAKRTRLSTPRMST